jgi:hypothetical protein
MENVDNLMVIGNQHLVNAMFAGTEEQHLREMNAGIKLWTEWGSLEDVKIIGDDTIINHKPRIPITLIATFEETICPGCGEEAEAYPEKLLVICRHCCNRFRVIENDVGEWIHYIKEIKKEGGALNAYS